MSKIRKKCLKSEKMKDIFPVKKSSLKMKTRRQKKLQTMKYQT